MSLKKDQLNQILEELAEVHGLTKEEIEIKPLPKIHGPSLPALKYRAKHLIDVGSIDQKAYYGAKKRSKSKTKKKYKSHHREYIRSARIQNQSTNTMVKRRAIFRKYTEAWHFDNFNHLILDEVPCCLKCDLPPTTIGDYIYAFFAPFYICEVCFSIRPTNIIKKHNPPKVLLTKEQQKQEIKRKIWMNYWRRKIRFYEQQDKKWVLHR